MLSNRLRCGNRLLNQHSLKLNSLVIFPWFASSPWPFFFCIKSTIWRPKKCPHQARGQNDHVTSLWHKELWRHSYILWKLVYRNTCYVFIILVANIIWLSDHVIRSSYLLDASFLHVSPQFFMSQRCDMIVLAARLMGTLFWPPNRTFNAKKKWSRRTR